MARPTFFPCLLAMVVVSASCLVGACGQSGRGSSESTSLQSRVQARLDSLDAVSTLHAKHLPTGRVVAVREDLPISTRSTIKIPIMLRAYRDAEEGRLDLDARHEITPNEMRGGSGILKTFDSGLRPTYRDLVTQMIITSDNTATDVILNEVGLERVNAMLAEMGYHDTRVRRTTGDLFRARWVWEDSSYKSLTHREVFERGFPRGNAEVEARDFVFAGDSTEWLGRSTAQEMSTLLEQIYTGVVASRTSTDAMIEILRRQFYSSRLPRRVRYQDVEVAHKTGDGPPNAGNDVGILLYDGGPVVVSVFTYQNRGSFLRLEETIARIAEDLIETWR